jgi:hypothetical protein
LLDQPYEHSVLFIIVNRHDYPAAKEDPLSRVAQDHRICCDHLHRLAKAELAKVRDPAADAVDLFGIILA